jgi:hypothetical protein
MGSSATSLAIVNAAGEVETFVRLDVPDGWTPPVGCTAVPDDELPVGWTRATPPLPPVPANVSARQIRLWLVTHGIALATIEAAIDSIADTPTRESVRVEWEYAPYVERSHPWLVPLASALGLDGAAVDQAFREAAVL